MSWTAAVAGTVLLEGVAVRVTGPAVGPLQVARPFALSFALEMAMWIWSGLLQVTGMMTLSAGMGQLPWREIVPELARNCC